MIIPIAAATVVAGAVIVNEIRSAKKPARPGLSGSAPVRMPDTWTTRGK